MITASTVTPGIDSISTSVEIPTLGSLAINAFVLHGDEPVLVDTGSIADSPAFMSTLESILDLRWVWLTHTDFDHIGSLAPLLDVNPDVRVITSFVGVGITGLTAHPLPMDRVYLINPGQSITIGDRTLTAVRPPVFDNPITTGFVDTTTRTLFTSDCFGALLSGIPDSAGDVSADELRDGQVRWATIDSAWVHDVDHDAFTANLDHFRAIEPDLVLSSHLPPAPGTMHNTLVDALALAPGADRYLGPDQVMLDVMLAQMAQTNIPATV